MQRDERARVQTLDHAALGQGCTQVSLIVLLAARVDDQHEMIAQICDHQIVEDAARGIGKKRVALSPFAETEQVDGDELFECARRIRHASETGAHDKLAHMRDVEQPRRCARMQMLLDDAGRILHRHVVTGERHHPRAEPHVQSTQRRMFERLSGIRIGHRAISPSLSHRTRWCDPRARVRAPPSLRRASGAASCGARS